MSDDEPSDKERVNPIVRVLQTVTPGFIRRSFAIKFGLVLLLMALSIGIIGVAATQTVTDQTEDRVTSDFEADAGQEASVIEQWLESNTDRLEITSQNPVWGDEDLGTLQIQLETEVDAGDISNAHLIEILPDGAAAEDAEEAADDPVSFSPGDMRVLASTDIPQNDIIGEDRQWALDRQTDIQRLGGNDVLYSDTYRVDGDLVVGFVSPAEGSDRYLFFEVSVASIQNALGGAEPDRDVGFTQVVNTGQYQGTGENNSVMIDARGFDADTEFPAVYSTDADSLEPLRLANELRGQEQRAGVIGEMDADPGIIDEPYTVGYAPIDHGDGNWVVVTHGPRSDVFGFVDTLSTWGIIISVVMVLLIGVTGSVLGYSTSSAINRLTGKTEEMREGNLDVDLHSSRIDNIGQLYDGFADMRDSLKEQIEESERARKEAEVARAEAEEMAEYLQDKAGEYSDIMQQVAAGDMTQRMTQDGEEESMDRIAEEFNEMIEELEKTTGQLKSYVDEVEEAGSEVEGSANTVREAGEQVADSIQKISDDAYDQKERLQRVSETMDGISTQLQAHATEHDDVSLDESLDQIQSVAGDINEIADLSEQTMAEAENVAGAAEEQAAELNEVSERANDLQRYAQPLRDILERFETEAEHEFVFSVGPTGSGSPNRNDD